MLETDAAENPPRGWDKGKILLVIAAMVWLVEKLALRGAVALQSPLLAGIVLLVFAAANVVMVVATLALFLLRNRYGWRVSVPALVVAGLWSVGRLTVMIVVAVAT